MTDKTALERVRKSAQNIIRTQLPSLSDIYSIEPDACRVARIIQDCSHPGNILFTLLPSMRRYRVIQATSVARNVKVGGPT